jgi:hypothetical protein
MKSFPSINQFRHLVKTVQFRSQYVGSDEHGDPIYDESIKLPKLKVEGTVKLHGTTAGVFVKNGELTCLSHTRIIVPGDDNHGFARYVNENQEVFLEMLEKVSSKVDTPDDSSLVVYGEWCGRGINSGCAIHQLEKMFVIFAVCTEYFDEEKDREWYDIRDFSDVSYPEVRIFSVIQFQTFNMEIDFENPKLSQNALIDLTLEVEKQCPVAKHFGVDGVGEGIVWVIKDPAFKGSKYWFKVKGDKHSVTKVKKLVEVDVEKLKTVEEFIEAVATEARLSQGWEYLKTEKKELSQKSTGVFIKWVFDDVIKEESDRLEASNLTKKDINSVLSKKSRTWFFSKLDESVGL